MDRIRRVAPSAQMSVEARMLVLARATALSYVRTDGQRQAIENVFEVLRQQVEAGVFVPCISFPLLAYHGVTGDDTGAVALTTATALLYASDHLYWRGHRHRMQLRARTAAPILVTVAALCLSDLDVSPATRVAVQRTLATGQMRLQAAAEVFRTFPRLTDTSPEDTEALLLDASGERGAMYMKSAAQVGGASADLATIYADLGGVLGTATQIIMDYEREFGAEPRTSSGIFTDTNPTLPVAMYLSRRNGAERRAFLRVLRETSDHATARAHTRPLLTADGLPDWCARTLLVYSARARSLLAEADPHSSARRCFEERLAALQIAARFDGQ